MLRKGVHKTNMPFGTSGENALASKAESDSAETNTSNPVAAEGIRNDICFSFVVYATQLGN